ncbi:tRNA-specific adenosine deaminase 1 [Hypsizygus marmoreus]|uniref:tRNA-specific adenosine deaminase 1 n=1 Tax=Hypsizygus marmoreus TaxID=39966 RepID=A0A369JJF4_HYPMA|nr:tRNA-specific adenosine deaminase 1 [Hypsizygus marmoreus]
MCIEDHVDSILTIYASTSFKPPSSQYTVAASFYLTHPTSPNTKVISIATGTKCLPTVRLPLKGEALHDSHAEVLARRGATRWFLEEIGRCQGSSDSRFQSNWIYQTSAGGKYDIREGVKVHLYISTVPCGDASMRFLAAVQDEEMAALKDSTVYAPLSPTAASRGRDNYSRLGVLRTKPGRADSPQTLCMSCSDKMASWNILGFQGALASRFLRPLYLSSVVIGEVSVEFQDVVREDCERALWKRLEHVTDEQRATGYTLHIPEVKFTSRPFLHSRTIVETARSTRGSCNESLAWIADSKPHEVLINGLKRGVSPKHRFREKSRPQLSKIAMFQLYTQTLKLMGLPYEEPTASYHEVKRHISDYQNAKDMLIGNQGPFSGWVRSGAKWESFNLPQ